MREGGKKIIITPKAGETGKEKGVSFSSETKESKTAFSPFINRAREEEGDVMIFPLRAMKLDKK